VTSCGSSSARRARVTDGRPSDRHRPGATMMIARV
jgi:hypothetical protein